jgi:hypothetical protein
MSNGNLCQDCGKETTSDEDTYTCDTCSKKPKGMNWGGGRSSSGGPDKREREHDCHGRSYDNDREPNLPS